MENTENNRDIFSLPLFRGCDKDTVNSIFEYSYPRSSSYRKDEIIAMQGYECRSVLLLCKGSAYARMVNEEGKEFILDTLSAPDVLASAFVFSSSKIFPVTILAAGDCEIRSIGRESLTRLLHSDKAVLDNYLTIVSDHSMFLSRRINEFALQTLSSRIISFIENDGPITNLSQAAFILGVARPSLSRVVSQLVSQGILTKTDFGYMLTEG